MIGLVLAFAAAAAPAAPRPELATSPEQTIRSLYRALERDDAAAYRRLTSPSFYAFDVGKRFAGRDLLDMIRTAHASGKLLQWDLSTMDVHTRGASAWATWENHGAVGTVGALQPMSWQESATLHRVGRAWKIDFLHSNRVEMAPVPNR